MRRLIPQSRLVRLALVLGLLAVTVAVLVWRGPDFGLLERAFRAVEWWWVAAAVGINLLSVIVRASAWRVVITQAIPSPWPSRRLVFSAFCVGLLANAVLPGRVGELARVGIVSRHIRRAGAWATIMGTVLAHRVFDVIVAVGLVVYVLYTARIPDWARPGLAVVVGVGVGVLLASVLLARRHHRPVADGLGPVRRLLRMGRHGLAVLRRPTPALGALVFQLLGWTAQLFAVWAAFQAFSIEAPIAAAALVLVLMNLVTVFPFWPGNVGLLQAAIALGLLSYGVSYPHGFAYGIGLQVIEVSVGVGLGLLFLAREGYSFALLKQMPEVTEVELDERVERIA
jgi:uncharacterized membrane protein YbhN (UPF0104 family)